MSKTMMLAACAVAATAFSAKGDFDMDRSVMSDKYWSIWNDEVQAKIDADIAATAATGSRPDYHSKLPQ